MNTRQIAQLEHILGTISLGIAIIDATSLRILYMNPYMQALLDNAWQLDDFTGQHIEDLIPADIDQLAEPIFRQVIASGTAAYFSEVPYEGFLEVRGRTYWSIRIEPHADHSSTRQQADSQETRQSLLITLEDVTESVRARLHLNAIHHISAAIAEASALPLVLDRILQALQDMVGSRRCAVFLLDQSLAGVEARAEEQEETIRTLISTPAIARIAAHMNVHPHSQTWQPEVNERLLLGRVAQEHQTLIITDTSTIPDIDLPFLDIDGEPVRPGSVLCVPIFDPYPSARQSGESADTILGTIEVYHRRARGFPQEEVKLLERFAWQAGLAIQNARLIRHTEHFARMASRNARQKENIMQAIPAGVVLYDPRWRVVDVNQAARQLFGWGNEVLGMDIRQAMTQSSATLLYLDFLRQADPSAELERRALSGQIDVFKLVNAEGQAYTIRCSYTPIQDEQGDIFAFVVIYQDMTRETAARERIEAEVVARTAELAQRNEALQQANAAQEILHARMELLLERLPSGVMLLNAHDISIELINRQAVQHLQKLGFPLEPRSDPAQAAIRAIGLPCEPLFSILRLYDPNGEAVPYEELPFYRALRLGQASEAELHTEEIEGQALYFLVNAAPLRTADGTISSIIVVLHEITTTKTLELAREGFFTTMAHELKTPLANIRAHLSALLASDLHWSPEKQIDFLRTADEQVERIVGMINQFLDASRVEAKALRLELEPIFLPEMFEDLQERLEALISASERHLKIDMPEHLPAVLGDYELLMSVLSNLLSNAFRYAPEGDSVTLKAEPVFSAQNQQPTGVTFSVSDRGPGISEEQQKQLFTRFSTFAARHRPAANRPGQPDTEKRHGGGRWSPATGLGLYISRGIIEAHGSTLIVKSKPGEGATFAFTLPVFAGRH